MKRFLTYEAYVAHNEIMNEEASSTSKMIPAWTTYERGVEALATSTTAIDQRETQSRKGLTLSDLGIKVSSNGVNPISVILIEATS